MIQGIRNTVVLVVAFATIAAQGQFYRPKGATISVGATGQFTKPLTTGAGNSSYVISTPSGGVINTTVSNSQQFTTNSTGFLISLGFHPVSWAGVEMNYGWTHYSEKFNFNTTSATPNQSVTVPTDAHEATAAYEFHPKRIPFQPFVNIGGGAIDFAPRNASNQWRGAGLVEAGFDIPTRSKHLAFRVEGRSLFYRAPNFYTSSISTKSWRATIEPAVSATYRF